MTNNWQKIKLGEVCTLIKGVTYKSEDYTTLGNGSVFLTLKSIAKGGGFNFDGVKYYKGSINEDQLVEPNDLIIANTDLTRAGDVIGAPLFVPQIDDKNQYVISMDITKLQIDASKLNKEYLYHYLSTTKVRNYMRAISNGSTVLHLKVKLVNDIDIPLPSLETQELIAQKLSQIDEQIHKTDQIIEKTEYLKQGLLEELVTKGLGHTIFKKTELGEIPQEWRIESLGNIAKVERGKFSHRPRNAPEFYGGDIPFIQTGDVVSSKGRIKSYSQTLNEKGLKVSKMFKKGTIVLTIAANIGDTAILEFDACFPDSLVGITPSEKVNPIYLEYFLKSRKEYLNSISTQSAQKNINLAKLNPMLIAVPPLSEQEKISSVLSSVDRELSIERETKENLLILKKGLMEDVFNRKVQIQA